MLILRHLFPMGGLQKSVLSFLHYLHLVSFTPVYEMELSVYQNLCERLAWGMKKSEMENQQRKKTKSKNREMER